jgi:CRP-like cAMP-binding protein
MAAEPVAARSGDRPVLNSIGDDERSNVLKVAIRRRFPRGEVVFHEGDPGDALHIVTSGLFVARSSSTMGELIGVNVFGEGAVFGELALLTDDVHRSATVVALQGGTTLMITRPHFDDLRARNPRVDRFLLSVLAERNRALSAQLVELLFTPVEQRVYRRLLDFSGAAASGEPSDGWVRLSQTELAVLAGTTRSTANRVLRRAEQCGLVELARGRMRVLDTPALSARAH